MTGADEFSAELARRQIGAQANEALVVGAKYSSLLGFGCAPLLALLQLVSPDQQLGIPIAFSAFGGLYSLAVWALARRGLLYGRLKYLVFLLFVSIPTGFLLLSHAAMPAGAATYITGPMTYLYFHLIIMSGFMFDGRLSVMCGAAASLGYQLAYLLARPELARLSHPDPALLADFTVAPIFGFKSVMMLFAGLVVGALSVIVRRLVMRVLEEQREKNTISRLFGQFVSAEVKDKIIREKSGLVGERRKVVVLFSDLRAFTTWSEAAQPEEIVGHLNVYFDGMVQCITGRGGVVDKFIGDAIMAVFGGLLELENPAEAALEAACRMREKLAEQNAAWRASGVHVFENGIGLHYGEVLQGVLGSAERKEFTVIGDTVNTASRLEGLTRELGCPVVLTRAFFDALGPASQARCRPLGRVKLKGRQQELEVFGVDDLPPAVSAA